MDTNISNFPTFRHSNDLNTNLRTVQTEKTKLAAVTENREMDLSLETQEGDRVTISFSAKSASFYGSNETATKNENGFAYQKTEFTASLSESELTFSVEGDLSEEELDDIKKVLKTIDQIMNHFVKGQLIPMAAKSKQLQGLENIAELDARFSYEKVTLTAQRSEINSVLGAQLPESGQGVDTALSSSKPKDEAVLQLLQAADTTAKEMAREASQTQIPSNRMQSLADQLFDDYRDRLKDFDPLGTKIMDRIADGFHNALGKG